MAEEGDDGKREDIRDEALTYLWVILYNVIRDKVFAKFNNVTHVLKCVFEFTQEQPWSNDDQTTH